MSWYSRLRYVAAHKGFVDSPLDLKWLRQRDFDYCLHHRHELPWWVLKKSLQSVDGLEVRRD